jgi:DNA-binding transcriptional MerR regulator
MNEDRLLSKKEVLEKMGISYGQLYRWKRKGLIPEEWFIRRATFTGQETFFPRDKIIPRIEQIKRMKEDHPLDDLAELITKRVNEGLGIALSRLRDLGWLDEAKYDIPGKDPVPMQDAFSIGVLQGLRETAREEEIDLARRALDTAMDMQLIERVRAEDLQLYLLRKRLSATGISAEISSVIIAGKETLFDPEIEVVRAVDLGAILEEIRLDLANNREKAKKEEK